MTRDHDNVRDYDIVLFGATGFTGTLAAGYLSRAAPPDTRLALAGRDRAKLEQLRDELASERHHPRVSLGVLVADSTDDASLARLARSTRVLISTVGPYLGHGEQLVAACVAAGTDYVDLAGEWEFVDLMYLRHHAAAKASGARLVHSCGFESVPVDLGALFTVSRIGAEVPIKLSGYVLASGSISGGTFHSAVQAIGRLKEGGRISRQRRTTERHADDGRMAEGRSVHGIAGRFHREPEAGGWVVPAPTIDPQHVLRSARLNPAYGPDFAYSHYIVTGSLPKTAAKAVGFSAVSTLAQLETTRNLILRLRQPGRGPGPERRAASHFRVRLVADYGDQHERLITEVRGGDPGYEETAKMVAEAALCLAFDDDAPDVGGGQWTPALACGQPLIDRLTAAGIELVTLSPDEVAAGA